ncbi:hypothetical protein LR48_Vigan11g149300 [Vigna angularis]|uniref:Uncharacterized protein n=1 Tax=Phaseolus angularis TaxID=3914 RepID=A0A0L9VUM7_PHAAN|nr:hypothetical protein LR48_Vigan11g149300 [Vigna angularis]
MHHQKLRHREDVEKRRPSPHETQASIFSSTTPSSKRNARRRDVGGQAPNVVERESRLGRKRLPSLHEPNQNREQEEEGSLPPCVAN